MKNSCKKCGKITETNNDGLCFECWLITEEDEHKKINLFQSIKKVFFNVLGFFVGYYLGYLCTLIATYIFVDLLGKVRFITAILSYPVEYQTYALSGIILTDAVSSLYSCAFVSKLGKSKHNYSCIVLGAVRIISYLSALVSTIYSNGFDLSSVWTIVVCLIGFVCITIATFNNSKL